MRNLSVVEANQGKFKCNAEEAERRIIMPFKYADNNVHQCWSCQNNEGQDIIKVPYGSDSNKIYVEFAIPECKVTGLYMEKVNRCPCPYYKQISEKSSENNGGRKYKTS